MFYATDGSCGGYRHGVWTAPSRCLTPVVAAGLVFYEQPRPRVWWAFACRDHAKHLTAARALLDRDRAEIARRRAAAPGERTEPLAVGRAAWELLDRARRWAAAHPEHVYIPPPAPSTTTDSPADSQRPASSRPFAGYARDAPARPRGAAT